ncbi:MAG: SCO2524 family protein [Actinomycetales bacterium]
MKILTRQEILRIWKATVEYSYRDGKWFWGGRTEANSISDAAQLLTVIYPASLIPSMPVDRPDRHGSDDVAEALGALGGRFDITQRLLEAMVEFHERYRDPHGVPVFSGGSYITAAEGSRQGPSLAQEDLDLVDSMSMSLTLCLAAVGMARTVRRVSQNSATIALCERLETLSSARLTAAMVGLLRSFSVGTFGSRSPEAEILGSLVNQGSRADRTVLADVYDELGELRASLRRQLTLGTGQVADELEDPTRLFACGWSWGLIADAPAIPASVDVGDRAAVAVDRPHVYFSLVALEGIQDLFSPRTRLLGVLDEEQQRLAASLQLRWEWTQTFWSTIATWGQGRWPLEDVPWISLDGDESEYYTLFITSLIMAGSPSRLAGTVVQDKLTGVLEELAARGRITRRPTPDDGQLALHSPGLRIPLRGAEIDGGPPVTCVVSSFGTMVLKRIFELAMEADTTPERQRLLDLADETWNHLSRRRLEGRSGEGLWDQPSEVFPSVTERFDGPSWFHTERVVEALVMSAHLITTDPLPDPELTARAAALIAEADHLLDQFRLSGLADTGQMPTMLSGSIANLERARELTTRRPGSAFVLATEALRALDEIAAASAPGY